MCFAVGNSLRIGVIPADGTRDKPQAAKAGKELYGPFGQCLRTDGGTGCLDLFS